MQHSVAFIVAAMNAEATIARAVQSALMQVETREVIVVDDASSDRTAEVARACDDGTHRLKIISLARNCGPSVARNVALEQVTAPWVGVLDADDLLLPNRLQKLLRRLDGASAPDLLADDLLIAMSGAEDGLYRPLGLIDDGAVLDLDLPSFVAGNIADPRRPRCEYGFLKPLMRRDFLEHHRLRYDASVRLGEDYVLYAQALAHGARFRVVPACGYVAVVRPDSLSHQHGTEDLRQLLAADERLLAMPGLSPQAVDVLNAHRQSIRRRLLHRAMLDAKRRGKYTEAFSYLFDSASTASYIVSQLLRDKFKHACP